MKRYLHPLLLLVYCALTTGLVLYFFRVPILVSMARFLTVSDQLKTADVIYVLGGDYLTRAPHAAALFNQGLATKIVLPKEEVSQAVQLGLQSHSTKITFDMLVKLGVDQSAIIILESSSGGVTSTYDEARVLKDYIESESINAVIIVTTAFHSRRSRWIFNKVLKGKSVEILMSPTEHTKFDKYNWWKVEKGLISYIEEYLKFFHYLFILRK